MSDTPRTAPTLSRRRFLGAVAAASLGTGLARSSGAGAPSAQAAAPARTVAKCVALGPAGNMYADPALQRYRFTENARFFERGMPTRWTRLWADWPTLQPVAGVPPGVDPPLPWARPSGARSPADALASLEADIAAANRAGIAVILTVDRVPAWANALTAALHPAAQGTKDRRRCFPDSADPFSPWAALIAFLVSRYSITTATPAVHVTALELTNEPNTTFWPQEVAAPLVTRMFRTASAITEQYAKTPMLVGPGTADDRTGDPAQMTPYDTFTAAVLTGLGEAAFYDRSFVWSQHSYADVMRDQGGGSLALDRLRAPEEERGILRAARTRTLLTDGAFAGALAADAAPALWLTEGGVIRPNLTADWGTGTVGGLWPARATTDERHAILLARNHARLTDPLEGAGILMTTNYLYTSSATFDSGLCDVTGAPHPEPFAAWSGFPS